MTEKGLREIIAAETKISDIDGDAGRLWYVGYEIGDLATNASFEETVYLLHNLDLPTPPQLDQLNTFLVGERTLHPFLARFMPTLAQNTSPMSMLRTGVSASSAFDPDGWDDSPEAEYRKAMRLIAEVPTMIATYHRLRTGQEIIPPNPALSHAANFLWMLHGEEPDPEDAARPRHDVRALRRPHDERLHVHRARGRLDPVGHVLGDLRGDRCAEGTAARRRERGGA